MATFARKRPNSDPPTERVRIGDETAFSAPVSRRTPLYPRRNTNTWRCEYCNRENDIGALTCGACQAGKPEEVQSIPRVISPEFAGYMMGIPQERETEKDRLRGWFDRVFFR